MLCRVSPHVPTVYSTRCFDERSFTLICGSFLRSTLGVWTLEVHLSRYIPAGRAAV